MVNAKATGQTFVPNPFSLGGPSFETGRHQGFIFELDYRAYAERDD